jgi:hypothetical protein
LLAPSTTSFKRHFVLWPEWLEFDDAVRSHIGWEGKKEFTRSNPAARWLAAALHLLLIRPKPPPPITKQIVDKIQWVAGSSWCFRADSSKITWQVFSNLNIVCVANNNLVFKRQPPLGAADWTSACKTSMTLTPSFAFSQGWINGGVAHENRSLAIKPVVFTYRLVVLSAFAGVKGANNRLHAGALQCAGGAADSFDHGSTRPSTDDVPTEIAISDSNVESAIDGYTGVGSE